MTWRAIQAAEKRRQREEEKRHRELERRAKERAKLSALEQARLEVEAHENRINLILSVHKEQAEVWNWNGISASLAPLPPQRRSYHEMKARCAIMMGDVACQEGRLEGARKLDEQEFQGAVKAYMEEKSE